VGDCGGLWGIVGGWDSRMGFEDGIRGWDSRMGFEDGIRGWDSRMGCGGLDSGIYIRVIHINRNIYYSINIDYLIWSKIPKAAINPKASHANISRALEILTL